MKQTVESATIASVGLSIFHASVPDSTDGSVFSPNNDSDGCLPPSTTKEEIKPIKYTCDNYNLLTLKQGDILISTSVGQFLCQHEYSFDAMFTKGIPFTPPGDMKHGNSDKRLHNLWTKIMTAMDLHNIPLILHNGLFDLVYLYHCFIGALPDTLGRFLVQITANFPSGLYDTRFMAGKADFDATFLAYVFSKSDRLRQNRFGGNVDGEPYFVVDVNSPFIEKQLIGEKRKRSVEEEGAKLDTQIKYCISYATAAHDVQIILDSKMGPSEYPQVYTSQRKDEDGAHAAHFDAYMTGFSFCYFQNTFNPIIMKSCLNRMTLSGFDVPLVFPVKKSKR
ncbi:ribonuclease H-like domain-containing protein [Mucor mucedo]|uniref:ribonuclease H-like domain-containing protein n=1 Tax=Mucor mucedo TaxID=29922 RepID=UPI00221FF47D|nr:ribonuclease H-like domain-containing protein [Mucor mucedo]KAI7873207.1 ribonuclease H-like domain-containing protein [Mucor mucedo]